MATLQETIRQLNETKGVEPTPPPAPPTTPPTEPKVPTPPPVTPPAQAAQTPAPGTQPTLPTTPPATQEKKKIQDPPFVKKPNEPVAVVTPPAPGTPATTPGTPAPEEPTVPDEKFYGRLSELTEGTIKDEAGFERLITRYNELEDIVAKGVEPKFADERAKLVHAVISKSIGSEPQEGIRILRAMAFKPEGKTDKEILFAGYLMNPQNADLTELTAQKYFEAEYESKYSGMEENLMKQREHAIAVKNAKAEISKIQDEFKLVEAPVQQENKELTSKITNAVQAFGGVKLSFTDNPKETELLTIPMADEQELARIQNEILHPNEAYTEFLSQFDYKTEQGYKDLVREIWERNHHVELRQEAYEHGRKMERIAIVNEAANASTPGKVDQIGAPAQPAGKSFLETWEEAQNGKQA